MSPVRILVVEDEGAVGRDVQNALARFGYSVADVARTGAEALEIVRRVDPDLIIMDIRLAGPMDGIEAARRIRDGYGKPVIFLTALADEETVARANEVGPEGYLLKPFSDSELQSAVEIAISRARSREALGTREEQFMSTLRSMADGVIATDIVGNITFMNPEAERLTGWRFADARHRTLGEVFAIADAAGKEAPVFAPGGSRGAGRRVALRGRGGERIWIEDNSAPLKDSHGSLVGLVVVFREAAAAAGADAGEGAGAGAHGGSSLRDIVEGIADPLVAVDPHWGITFVNRRAAEQFGRPDSALVGASFWELLPPEAREAHYRDGDRALSRRERCSFEFHQPDSSRWYEANAYPFGAGLLVLLRDVTERREEQQRAARLEKLESLGLLARGFAHDFNNILTVMLGNLSLAEMKLPEGIDGREELEQARLATIRAQNRVHQLLTFAKGGAPIRRRIDPAALLAEVERDLERLPRVRYRFEPAPGLWEIDADPGQLRRVLENLITNAEEAMPEGGDLVLRAFNAPPGAPGRESLPAALELDAAADYLVLQVEDGGHGVPEDLLDKLFEPYFSTRGEANATGIGLTVCESIARAHNGAVAIESEPGSGAVVSVALPAPPREERRGAPAGEVAAKPEPQRVKPRILVLEDEALIRQLLVANLRQGGYEVAETADGVEAVARYIEAFDRGERFDLVITDLSIPNGMGGVKAVEEIRAIDPEAKAIVSSGYSDDPAMSQPERYGFAAVLPKPYQPKQLLDMVRGVLGAG